MLNEILDLINKVREKLCTKCKHQNKCYNEQNSCDKFDARLEKEMNNKVVEL